METRANWRQCLTSIKVRIVSGWRLARHIEMVSQPPEKICSTATAEPSSIKALVSCTVEKKYKSLTRNSKDISSKMVQVGKLGTSPSPPIKWLACIKIFLSKLEVIFEFIRNSVVGPLVSGSEVNLLGWSILQDWCGGWRAFVSARHEARVIVVIECVQR